MLHLATVLSPRAHGLTPYRVTFQRPHSPPLRSMRDEGIVYRHPERHEEAIVWAQETAGIVAVLTYHYGHDWSDLHIAAPSGACA
jgi:hypothetical protein